ncbi:Maltose permease MAL31 like protein [Verticillium longisporum]|uniref:Maltose permease MAL31 like protein n=1 Tax=Verticillium longisporum TaxID=100787 RepID=A0A8I2ZWV7_VERLO|nr:Maltose permease MAL31 like protein [Verticillium longisporum]
MELDKKNDPDMVADDEVTDQLARLANQDEHDIGKRESFRRFPKSYLWCLYAVFLVLLGSFENQAAGVILGIPKFREDFGHQFNDEHVIDASWQAAFNGAPIATAVMGALGGGQLADWIGRKKVIMMALVIAYGAITMELLATSPALFLGGKLLNGFSIGAIQGITVTYIGEVTPLALRGIFTCLSALSYTIGPLIVALIVNETGDLPNRWAYRAVFVAQYGFAAIATLFVAFMPESPWWLASKDRDEAALKSLNNLGHRGDEGQKRLAAIKHTLAQVSSETAGATYIECFRKSNLRRTIVSIAPLCIQSLSGVMFAAGYSTYYMQRAGYSTAMSFKLQITQQVLSTIGNVMSWWLIDRVGRRSLTFWGLFVLTIILFATGSLAIFADREPGGPEARATVAFILIYCWWYNATIGATAYTVLCEVSTSRLRIKTIAIGLAAQNSLNVMFSFVLPYLFNPDHLNLGAKISYIFGVLAIISLVFLWFYHPETAGRTYEELDEMFMKKVPARKFKSYQPDTAAMGEVVKAAFEKEELQGEVTHRA